MKERFETPQVETIRFDDQDAILLASGGCSSVCVAEDPAKEPCWTNECPTYDPNAI